MYLTFKQKKKQNSTIKDENLINIISKKRNCVVVRGLWKYY